MRAGVIPYRQRGWLRLLLSLHGSSSRGVGPRVLAFGMIAAAVVAVDRYGFELHLPAGVHEVGGALSALVLAFRANTAYSRFWEGRTLWGAIVNASRNLDRLVRHHVRGEDPAVRQIATFIVVFAHAARRHLRGEPRCPEVARLLSPDELAAFEAAPHRALHAAGELSRRVSGLGARGALDPLQAAWAERLVASLVDSLGGCERIRKTPTPLGFVLLLKRFFVLYLATLPFSLVTRVEMLAPLVTMLVAYPMLLIDALGAELDDPFGHDASDLPLTRICATIERDVLGSELPPELVYASTAAGDED